MDDTAFILALAGFLFYSAALGFWTYAFLNHGREDIDLALRFCVLFGSAGSLMLVVWRVTSA